MGTELLVYGAGGFAREVAWLAEEAGYKVLAFVDDDPSRWGRVLNGIPVISLEEAQAQHPGALFTVAVGNPLTRKRLVEKVQERGFGFATLVHPQVSMSRFVEVGRGSVITVGNILTVNVRLGQHVHVNLDCTIGHDAVLEDYATLAPGVHVSGWVFIKEGAYIGTGAVIINGTEDKPLEIGTYAVVGAGAVVTKDVPPGVTVVGVPAKPLSK
jgi:sugar O-acyltransferase (sialic acid O-acetyltransferase NeuD family)